MLRRNVPRVRHNRHRLRATPTLGRQQTGAISPKRPLPISMPDNLRQFIDVRRKAIRMFQFAPETHPSLPVIGISTAI